MGIDSRARLGQGATGEVGRRRPGAVAAAAVLPVRWRLHGDNGYASELGGVQRKVRERLFWRAVDRSPELARAANNGAGGAQGGGGAGMRRGGRGLRFIGVQQASASASTHKRGEESSRHRGVPSTARGSDDVVPGTA
jgi:hypothetical protein